MEQNPVTLLYCGDRKMIKGIFLCLLTLQRFTPAPLKVYLFSMDVAFRGKEGHAISQEDVTFLQSYFSQGPQPIDFVLVEAGKRYQEVFINNINEETSFSPYSMLRLLAPDFLNDDHVLYLDADTMTCQSILPLWERDLRGYEMGVVLDHLASFWRADYFNSGVLDINLAECRASGLFPKTIVYLLNHHLFMPDQTSLNDVIARKLILPECYNQQRKGWQEDTVIKHFSKVVKTMPFPHYENCKQWNISKVHAIYKTRFFDPFFAIFLRDFPFERFGEKRPSEIDLSK
jgi:lipopolysaccharide biosynthesis glycosyltransferase